MNKDQLLEFLTQRWIFVVTFFNELYPQVAQIIPNFYLILSQQISVANNQLYVTIITYVNNQLTIIRTMITSQTNQLLVMINVSITQGQAFTIQQIENLRAFFLGRIDYLQGFVEYNVARLDASIQVLTHKIEYEIAKLKSEILGRLGKLENDFNKIVHVAHLDNFQAISFLGYFLKAPYQVIADILIEMFFSLILHVIGMGLIDENEENDPIPTFDHIQHYPKPTGSITPTED